MKIHVLKDKDGIYKVFKRKIGIGYFEITEDFEPPPDAEIITAFSKERLDQLFPPGVEMVLIDRSQKDSTAKAPEVTDEEILRFEPINGKNVLLNTHENSSKIYSFGAQNQKEDYLFSDSSNRVSVEEMKSRLNKEISLYFRLSTKTKQDQEVKRCQKWYLQGIIEACKLIYPERVSELSELFDGIV